MGVDTGGIVVEVFNCIIGGRGGVVIIDPTTAAKA